MSAPESTEKPLLCINFFRLTNLFLFLFSLAFLSCGILKLGVGTGNGQPYTGVDPDVSDPDDPGQQGSYELKAVSQNLKVLVSYQNAGVHDVHLFSRDIAGSAFKLERSFIAEKEKFGQAIRYKSDGLVIDAIDQSGGNLVVSIKVDLGDLKLSDDSLMGKSFSCEGKVGLAPFAGGSGLISDPYKICGLSQLNNIRDSFLSSSFVLLSDVDLTPSHTWNGGGGWQPIGTYAAPFAGQFDGNLRVISNLRIDYPDTSLKLGGLFAVASGSAVLSNLTLSNAFVKVSYASNGGAGLLVARAFGILIKNCHSDGDISSQGFAAGGLVGNLEEEVDGQPCQYSISNSSSSATVFAKSGRAGGLVGHIDCRGLVERSFTTGSIEVSGTGFGAGGIIGTTYYNEIDSSWSLAAVTSGNGSGGIVGIAYGGSVSNSYALGRIESTANGAGGIVGRTVNGVEIRNSYSASEIIAASGSIGGIVGHSRYPKIYDSFFVGTLGGTSISNIGAIAGWVENIGSASILNSYWLEAAPLSCVGSSPGHACDSGALPTSSGASISDFYLSSQAPMDQWAFPDTWKEMPSALPQLKWHH